MPISTVLSNVYTINVASLPNQCSVYILPSPSRSNCKSLSLYLSQHSLVIQSIEVTTGPALSTSPPACAYHSQGVSANLFESLPPDLAAMISDSETEPETEEEPELVMPKVSDLKVCVLYLI